MGGTVSPGEPLLNAVIDEQPKVLSAACFLTPFRRGHGGGAGAMGRASAGAGGEGRSMIAGRRAGRQGLAVPVIPRRAAPAGLFTAAQTGMPRKAAGVFIRQPEGSAVLP